MKNDERINLSNTLNTSLANSLFKPNPRMLTTTEEIYKTEENKFLQRIEYASKSPTLKNTCISRSLTKNFGVNYFITSKKSPTNLVSLNSKDGKINFPPIYLDRRTFLDTNKEKSFNSEKKIKKKRFSIKNIVKACQEETEKNIFSQSFKKKIEKSSSIVREYTKEINWASDKLMEVNSFEKDLMKKLYEELKSSKELYENEKSRVIKDYTTISLSDYKQKQRDARKIRMKKKKT